MEQDAWSDEVALSNYHDLKELLEEAFAKAGLTDDPREAKGFLIDVQRHFKGLMLRREDREELYNRLQEAFRIVNEKLDEERRSLEHVSETGYRELKPLVEEAVERAIGNDDLKTTWNFLLDVQNRLKEAKLLHEHREELYQDLQEAFGEVKRRREAEHQAFDQEARRNYQRLKPLIDEALVLAGETHEYKETREYLKKLQGEFKGLRLAHEQREELYSRLQTAFDILGTRLDDFFRNKKKNWNVKMQYTLSRFSADIFELQRSLEKDEDELAELKDQYDILSSSGKGNETLAGLRARIDSARHAIEKKKRQIQEIESEETTLRMRLEDPETPIS